MQLFLRTVKEHSNYTNVQIQVCDQIKIYEKTSSSTKKRNRCLWLLAAAIYASLVLGKNLLYINPLYLLYRNLLYIK